MKTYSDYTIQKLPDKLKIYKHSNKFWWSGELDRWICTDVDLIKHILNDKKFEVPTYSVEKIASKLSINLDHNIRLVKYFPIAQENEPHKLIRKRHALQLAKNSNIALQNFEVYFQQRFQELIRKDSSIINLYEDLLLPSINVLLGSLAEIDPGQLLGFDSFSQVLDETLPLRIRIKLNHSIGELIELLPNDIDEDEKYFRVAMIALGSDSLMGTFSESLVHILQLAEGKSLNQISWPDDVPVTGVPVIERVLTEDYELDGRLMKCGHKVRLYLDAAGYIESEMPSYSQLYFGSGSHSCIGMSIGRQVWKTMVSTFKCTDKKIHIQEMARRNYDNVFNLYDQIKVNFYA